MDPQTEQEATAGVVRESSFLRRPGVHGMTGIGPDHKKHLHPRPDASRRHEAMTAMTPKLEVGHEQSVTEGGKEAEDANQDQLV